MSGTGTAGTARKLPRARCLFVIAGAGLLAGGCSSQLESAQALLTAVQAPNLAEATNPPAQDNRSELQKATQYWGKAYAKNPRDAQAAINYAKNLKALGEKQQALAVLQQVSTFHGTNRALNAEYGRLALEFDQVSLAQKLLEQADDPANPDWRVISARGTVLAKQGIYKDAIAHYQRALTVAPNEASILNNLALAYAMTGEADKAEPLLKRAAAAGGSNEARVSQNLALVLGLQGKYDEAKIAAARDLSADKAAANVDYVRSIVNLEPKPLMTGAVDKPEDKQAAPVAKKSAAADAKKLAAADAKRGAKKKKDPAVDDRTDDRPTEAASPWATQVAVAKGAR
jgi:Flp pilus assembly protein TadD